MEKQEVRNPFEWENDMIDSLIKDVPDETISAFQDDSWLLHTDSTWIFSVKSA